MFGYIIVVPYLFRTVNDRSEIDLAVLALILMLVLKDGVKLLTVGKHRIIHLHLWQPCNLTLVYVVLKGL